MSATDDGESSDVPMQYATDETPSEDSQSAAEAHADAQAEEEEMMETGNAAQPRHMFKTSISKRANAALGCICASLNRLLETYTKARWAAQTLAAHARPEQTVEAQGQPAAPQPALDDSNEGEHPSAAPAETAPAAGVQQGASKARKKVLVEPHAFLLISMPDGNLKFFTSQSIKDNELARRQRDAFIGAVHLIVTEEQIRGSIDRRAELAGRKVASDRGELAAGRHEAPSKQWRKFAREAFTAHIHPTNRAAGLHMCPDGQHHWRLCIVRPGSAICTAGGLCSLAREAHDWPDDLQCIDPARVTPDVAWNKSFLLWQQSLGHDVTLPAEDAQR